MLLKKHTTEAQPLQVISSEAITDITFIKCTRMLKYRRIFISQGAEQHLVAQWADCRWESPRLLPHFPSELSSHQSKIKILAVCLWYRKIPPSISPYSREDAKPTMQSIPPTSHPNTCALPSLSHCRMRNGNHKLLQEVVS